MNRILLVLLALVACAGTALAKGVPTFQNVDQAKKAAEKSGKATLVVAGVNVPKANTNPRDSFSKLFREHEAVAERAAKFELAYVEAYSPSDCQNGNNCVSPYVRKTYGTPLAVSVWSPSGQAYMWKHEISEQTFTNNDPTPSGDELVKILDQALVGWAAWQKLLEDILKAAEAKNLKDKKLKTVEHQKALAEYYLHGAMADDAAACLRMAEKLASKAAKDDPAMA
ncbi:MAG: hypothetical protein KDB07_05995, partial [Planctomycetes bacterium]|nr:hypothetical protein [Planctomycetota bacterium]